MTQPKKQSWRKVVRHYLAPCLMVGLSLAATACDPEEEKKNAEWAHSTVGAYERGKALGAKGDMVTLSSHITSYVTDHGSLPDVEDMQELAQVLEDAGYAKRVKVNDPWGGEYSFWTDGSSWSVTSWGKDQEEDTGDDMEMEDGAMTKLPDGIKRL